MADLLLVLLTMILGGCVSFAAWSAAEHLFGSTKSSASVQNPQTSGDAVSPQVAPGIDAAGLASPDLLTLDTKVSALGEKIAEIARNQEEMMSGRMSWESRLLEEMRAIISVQDPEISMAIKRIDDGVRDVRSSIGLKDPDAQTETPDGDATETDIMDSPEMAEDFAAQAAERDGIEADDTEPGDIQEEPPPGDAVEEERDWRDLSDIDGTIEEMESSKVPKQQTIGLA